MRIFLDKTPVITLPFALLLFALGCGNQPVPDPAPAPFGPLGPPRIDGASALQEVARFVELGPKEAGTPGAETAARYLNDRLQELGIKSEISEFEEETPIGKRAFRNVIGRVPGQGSGKVLLCSHFDTKSGIASDFQGANDSGSSTGLLLEMAGTLTRAQEERPLPFDVWFVFFDGEECARRYGPNDGLHGSRHLAGQLVSDGTAKQVKAVIVLDMIGDKDLTVTLPRNGSSELISAVFKAAHEENARSKFSLHPMEIGDDHEPFHLAGMPAVDVIDFLYGSAKGLNDYWHTPADTMDKISAESLEIVGNVVMRVVYGLAGGE